MNKSGTEVSDNNWNDSVDLPPLEEAVFDDQGIIKFSVEHIKQGYEELVSLYSSYKRGIVSKKIRKAIKESEKFFDNNPFTFNIDGEVFKKKARIEVFGLNYERNMDYQRLRNELSSTTQILNN